MGKRHRVNVYSEHFRSQTVMVCPDLEKVFDKIRHKGLLFKMQIVGC